jgi:hypothetical protein
MTAASCKPSKYRQRQFGGAGIAEHDLDTLLLEQIEEGALS